MRIDPFFYKQPTMSFIDDLCRPIHEKAPHGFGKRLFARENEICVRGLYLQNRFPECDELLLTSYEDFYAFISVTDIGGNTYPLIMKKEKVAGEESFRLVIRSNCIVLFAEECEGVRRALVYLEEEMTKREGPFLPLGVIEKKPYIKRRLTRGFFSPTNRAPKFGDELLDDIDYYPEGYLCRLVHSNTNGLWIYTSFRALIDMPTFEQNKEAVARRIEKLSRVVDSCKRYGIKVYIFAIEPFGIPKNEVSEHHELIGVDTYLGKSMCVRREKSREYVIGAVEKLFRTVPDLGGLISITAGERPTSCPSVANYKDCPFCSGFSRGENLAFVVDCIKEGIRRAGTGADFVSWTYGHRYWEEKDIREYASKAPSDIILMQNFEDCGINIQLGKERLACDYWLSYVGPCNNYIATAEEAMKNGAEMWAKMQVCNSHELATVPYIPVPGILYDKYKIAREMGTVGIMECWYFGNYPSIMSRASGALSFLDFFCSKEEFLLDFAARLYGESNAEQIKNAWLAFEKGYKCYPTNVMFNYYGPMHDGVVWELSLFPKDLSLPRTWLLTDPTDGDRIGECLFRGHTLKEAITLCEEMRDNWKKGLEFLPLPDVDELVNVSRALGLLFSSGCNILKFYLLRAKLGKGDGEAYETLEEMKQIIADEIENSKKMTELCRIDCRLGYHSEAEGFKFFPEKLESRIDSLLRLLKEDFPLAEERLLKGLPVIGDYYAENKDLYRIGGEWIELAPNRRFRVDATEDGICLTTEARKGDMLAIGYEFDLYMPECTLVISEDKMLFNSESTELFSAGLGFDRDSLSHQSLFGKGIANELSHHRFEKEELQNGTMLYRVYTEVPIEKWNRKTAIRMRLCIGDSCFKSSDDPVITLGKENIIPDEYGYMMVK